MKPIPSTAIETVSGRIVDFNNLKPEDFQIKDIAWSISREPRFSGHTVLPLPYSVGQHSTEVARLVLEAFNTRSLLHSHAMNHFANNSDVRVWIMALSDSASCSWVGLLGLLHDGSEAYLRDLSSPIKNLPGLKEAYMALETKVMDQILIQFGLHDRPNLRLAWELVHWADIYARSVEVHWLMPSRGAHWPKGVRMDDVDLERFIQPKPHLEVYDAFLAEFERLSA